jgi:hypothetical protein
MPYQPSDINRSKVELLKGAWRLPLIAFILTADHASLFWLNTPAPKLLRRILQSRPRADFHDPSPSEQEDLARLWRLATLCLRFLFFTSKPCLRRCLLLLRCCRRWGVRCGLVIGVSLNQGELKGHSWMLIGGRPFFELPESVSRYKPVLTAHSEGSLEYHFKNQSDRDYAAALC